MDVAFCPKPSASSRSLSLDCSGKAPFKIFFTRRYWNSTSGDATQKPFHGRRPSKSSSAWNQIRLPHR
jgi:hypothetical protein